MRKSQQSTVEGLDLFFTAMDKKNHFDVKSKSSPSMQN
jgi:hypothetical protein